VGRRLQSINEPADPTEALLVPSYRRLYEAIPLTTAFLFETQREKELFVRNILLAEPMLKEYGKLFRGMDAAEIKMMRSFRFENCVRREELASILAEQAVYSAGLTWSEVHDQRRERYSELP